MKDVLFQSSVVERAALEAAKKIDLIARVPDPVLVGKRAGGRARMTE